MTANQGIPGIEGVGGCNVHPARDSRPDPGVGGLRPSAFPANRTGRVARTASHIQGGIRWTAGK